MIRILLMILVLLMALIIKMVISTPRNTLVVDYRPLDLFALFKDKQAFDLYQQVSGTQLRRRIVGNIPAHVGLYAEWSPDKKWVVSNAANSDSVYRSQIYLLNVGTGQQIPVPVKHQGVEFDWARRPTWAPGGTQIAFMGQMNYQEGIYIMNVECLLKGKWCVPEPRLLTAEGSSPAWSPDGSEIAYYVHGQGTCIQKSAGQTSGMNDLYCMNTPLDHPGWSPNGTKIVGICRDTQADNVCVMDRDGGNLRYLTKNTKYADVQSPLWSPDGEYIAYISRFSDRPIISFCPDAECPYATTIFIITPDGRAIDHLPFNNHVEIHWFTWYP